jgi:peptidoglycan hydrolase CwlO-like protein
MQITDVIIPAVTGFLTFLLGQQRGKKEIESITLTNLEKSVQIYQTIINDLKEEISKLNIKVDELQEKVDSMMEENLKLKKMLSKKNYTS